MESTVIKPNYEDKLVEILRMGALSKTELQECLSKNEKFKDFKVEIKGKIVVNHDHDEKIDTGTLNAQIAPGQFLKHYSPLIDAYILDNSTTESSFSYIQHKDLKRAILLDFNKQVINEYGNVFGSVKDLSVEGSDIEVIKNLYDYLHWTETCQGMERLLICDLSKYLKSSIHYETLCDRLQKVTSSKRIKII